MEKEEKFIFKRVAWVVGVIFLFNIGAFLFKAGSNIKKGISGMSVSAVSDIYGGISNTSKLFLAIQWVLLIFILFFVYRRDKDLKIRKDELKGINLKLLSSKKGTDLDTLYHLLGRKKQLRLSTISKIFKIKKETALDWCRILEGSSLVSVETFGNDGVIKFQN